MATSDYLKPISFLVVDGGAYMRRVIKGILRRWAASASTRLTTAARPSIMRSWPPNIVLTEALLAPMNGVELLKAIRADKGSSSSHP